MRTKLFPLILFACFDLLAFKGTAQLLVSDPSFNSVDTGWGNGDAADQSVRRVVVSHDGKIYIGGVFNTYHGIVSRSLVRLLSNGQVDPTFAIGSSLQAGWIYKLIVQPDGKLLVAGMLTSFNNQPVRGVIRLMPDGTLDPDFMLNQTNAEVYDMLLMNDGRILIGGTFGIFNGVVRHSVARLLPNGSVDMSFDAGTGPQLGYTPGPGEPVYEGSRILALALQSDGKILVGGRFATFSGTPLAHLVRLESTGQMDLSFSTNFFYSNDPNNMTSVGSLIVQPSGKIVISGNVSAQGPTTSYFLRVLADGQVDTSFGSGSGIDTPALSLSGTSDGRMILMGRFSFYNSTPVPRVIMLDHNGNMMPAFNIGEGFNDNVFDCAETLDNGFIFVGVFTRYQQKGRTRVAKLWSNGTLDLSFNELGTGLNRTHAYYTVSTIHKLSSGDLLVGGSFTGYNNILQNGFVKIDVNGVPDPSFNSGTGPDGDIHSFAEDAQGRILIGGRFDKFNGAPTNGLVRTFADGTVDPGFALDASFVFGVRAVEPLSSGQLLVAGYEPVYAAPSLARIKRLNEDGTIDPTFNAGGTGPSGGAIDQILRQPDGKILLAGYFFTYNGVSRRHILRLNSNGTLDNGFTVGVGFSHRVHCIALQPDGKILVGGEFISYNGASVHKIARLLPDGSLDGSFTPPEIDGSIHAMLQRPDGKIYIGGDFINVGNESRSRFALLNSDGSLDMDVSFGAGFNKDVTALLYTGTQELLVGGLFTAFDGIGRNRLVKLTPSFPTIVDGDLSGYGSPFPLPTTGPITIPDGITGYLKVLDTSGKEVRSTNLTGSNAKIDLSPLPPGVYILDYPSSDGRKRIQVILE